jgi:hypothetical protein
MKFTLAILALVASAIAAPIAAPDAAPEAEAAPEPQGKYATYGMWLFICWFTQAYNTLRHIRKPGTTPTSSSYLCQLRHLQAPTRWLWNVQVLQGVGPVRMI